MAFRLYLSCSRRESELGLSERLKESESSGLSERLKESESSGLSERLKESESSGLSERLAQFPWREELRPQWSPFNVQADFTGIRYPSSVSLMRQAAHLSFKEWYPVMVAPGP